MSVDPCCSLAQWHIKIPSISFVSQNFLVQTISFCTFFTIYAFRKWWRPDVSFRTVAATCLNDTYVNNIHSANSPVSTLWNHSAGQECCRDWTCNLWPLQGSLRPLSRGDTAPLSVTHHSSPHCSLLTFVPARTCSPQTIRSTSQCR